MINDYELQEIKGGGKWKYYGFGAGIIVSFVVGLIDGQIKLKWQNRKNTEFKGNSEGKPLIQIRRKD